MSLFALNAAHAELKTSLTQAIDEFGASARGYSNQQELFRRIERFVAIFLRVDGAEEELVSRATRIANSCEQWSGHTQAVKRSIRASKSTPRYLAKAVKYLGSQSAATPKWRQEIERHKEYIELILRSILRLSDAGKSALKKWNAACRDVLRKTAALDADGCWFLLQLYRAGERKPSEDAIAAKAIVSDFGGHWLTDVRKAADSLMDWANERIENELKRRSSPILRASRPRVRANKPKLFPGGVPKNQDVADLVVRLDAEGYSDKSQNQIAREFTNGNDAKAKSLLSQVRRLKRQGRVIL